MISKRHKYIFVGVDNPSRDIIEHFEFYSDEASHYEYDHMKKYYVFAFNHRIFTSKLIQELCCKS